MLRHVRRCKQDRSSTGMVRHPRCYRTVRQRRQDRQVITRFTVTMSQIGVVTGGLTRTRGNFADLYCPAASFVPYMSNGLEERR